MGTHAQMAVLGSGAVPAGTAVSMPSANLPGASPMEEHAAWPMIARLPVTLAVTIPLRGLRVRNLLSLRTGQTIESTWAATEDVPLKVGALQLGWGEFEVVAQQMALRLTRLA
jgi:flagellar motor switch/type III secretory pathway protein FliN